MFNTCPLLCTLAVQRTRHTRPQLSLLRHGCTEYGVLRRKWYACDETYILEVQHCRCALLPLICTVQEIVLDSRDRLACSMLATIAHGYLYGQGMVPASRRNSADILGVFLGRAERRPINLGN